MRSTSARWWRAGLVAALCVSVAAVTITSPAHADPGEDTGGGASLREQLTDAARGYLDAKTKLAAAQKRQKELVVEIASVTDELRVRSSTVDKLVAAAYRTGPLASVASLLASESPAAFVERVTMLDVLASNENAQLRELTTTQVKITEAKLAIDAQVKEQQKQLGVMAQRKRQAEKALAQVGGQTTSGFVGGTGTAQPAPRNADGSWPYEGCTVDDPTTSGCITARTLHALNQAKAAGYTRYVSCYRSGGSGEHPKGRACDFAAQVGGFGGAATGGDRTYGNNLASYYVRNASRLGVLYVIWYRQIWMASTGWRAYSGGGSASADHTNHVHLSVY